MATPQFEGPDGVLRQDTIFSTTLPSRFFTGTTDADTADMQVSIRGAAFTADPDFIVFEGTSFTVPNPSVYTDGLQLLAGSNVIQVKAILTNGTVTGAATIDAQLSLEQDIRGVAEAPSGVFIERLDNTVRVTVEGIDDDNVQGYNFYASVSPGGGTFGYTRINPAIIVTGDTIETTDELGSLEVDAEIATNTDGTPAADPLFMVVTGQQQDSDGTVLQADFDEALEVSETVTRIRTSVEINAVRETQQFSFIHDRQATVDSSVNPAIPNGEFNAIQREDPLYYVVTAIYLIDGIEIESEFSPEVSGAPMSISTTLGTFPQVSRQQILQDATISIFRSQPGLRIDPGSVTRDTFLDPFSTEGERIRFIVDFLHNAQSFTTLLAIDDPGFSGESIPVEQSPYKLALRQAFFLEDNASVQAIIDNAFDKLAGNFGVLRRGGRRSRGEVTFSLPSAPTTTQQFVIGQEVSGGGFNFRTTSFSQITTSGAGASFNPVTGRFSTRAFIQADDPGSGGNLAPGSITTIIGGPTGATVTNESRTFGGLDIETNRDLAVRTMALLSAVDSGTYQGYVKTAIEIPGVLQVNVVDPGHPLMQRDIDPATGRHIGGTVDLWIRGESLATVTDNFAFAFELAPNTQFQIVGAPENLTFRAVDSRLSTTNPIIEMIERADLGYTFRNGSTTEVYDLTDVEITSYNTIRLSSEYNSSAGISLSNVFFGTYRYRSGDRYVMTRQPVTEILSLSGDPDRSGVIASTYYDLYRGSDPLELGRSTEAGDYLLVSQPVEATGDTVPSSTPIDVTDESHVMLSGIEYLNNLGVNPLTVAVWNSAKTAQYIGPFDSGTNDFTFIDEEGSNPLGILLTDASNINEGETVLVDYQHDENFVVTYTYNSLLSVVQESVEDFRHLTADALAKEAVASPVDITGTVVVQQGLDTSTVDSRVRTALSRLFSSLILGEPLRQSDIIEAIDSVDGVSYVVVPLTRIARGDDSLVVRESVATDQTADYTEITDPNWSTDMVTVFLLENPLSSSTDDAGGPINESRGVYGNEARFTHIETPPNINGIPIRNQANAAFIIGNLGLEIPGYSDDATLEARYVFDTDPDVKAVQIDDKRREITSDRVLVALPAGETPVDYEFTVTYLVLGDGGVKNIEPGPTEYLDVGEWEFTYDEDIDFTARVTGRVG
jgi:uncharacterized phage protein gp47/JayE